MQYNLILVSQMSKPLTEEDNNLLVPKVLAGDKEARDKMITGNMGLVFTKVNTFIRTHPSAGHLCDDLTSAGFTGLIEAVDCLSPEIDNPMGYISSRIYHRLIDLLEIEMLVRVPNESKRQAKKKNQSLRVCRVEPLGEDRFTNNQTDFEMRDLIESCCPTEGDQELIRLRELGHTLPEISTKFGKPLVTVFRLFDDIRERVAKKLKDLT